MQDGDDWRGNSKVAPQATAVMGATPAAKLHLREHGCSFTRTNAKERSGKHHIVLLSSHLQEDFTNEAVKQILIVEYFSCTHHNSNSGPTLCSGQLLSQSGSYGYGFTDTSVVEEMAHMGKVEKYEAFLGVRVSQNFSQTSASARGLEKHNLKLVSQSRNHRGHENQEEAGSESYLMSKGRRLGASEWTKTANPHNGRMNAHG